VNLLPVLENAATRTRNSALAGVFGQSVTITDGDWVLHQSPVEGNKPLYWHGTGLSRFMAVKLGSVVDGRREAIAPERSMPTWLSDKRADPNELANLAETRPDKLKEMQAALKQTRLGINAPKEQVARLGL